MITRKTHFLLSIAASLLIIQLSLEGCKKYDNENPSGGNGQTGQLSVLMTDAPASFLHVNIHIKSVEVHRAGTDTTNPSGWITLLTRDTIYDLLALRNDITAALASGTLPVGEITQLRLILGTDNTVVLSDSSVHTLTIPSSQNTGIKINIDSRIMANKTVMITLDFDAGESIYQDGTGDYRLGPVIKVKAITFL
jgi:hypothetical protein